MSLPATPLFPWQHPRQAELHDLLLSHVDDRTFPCVGAKAAMARDTLAVLGCSRMDSAWDDLRIHDALGKFAADYTADPALFRSLAVSFEGPDDLTEELFEGLLWQRLQSLADKDVWRGYPVDPRVNHDPDSPHFSMSFGGQAFFVVGLHPHASRPARRFPNPTLVFNLHDQFEVLRAQGKYEPIRAKILARDRALAGSDNPMLARHGSSSEARQYSGRAVPDGWECPFARAAAQNDNGDLLPS